MTKIKRLLKKYMPKDTPKEAIEHIETKIYNYIEELIPTPLTEPVQNALHQAVKNGEELFCVRFRKNFANFKDIIFEDEAETDVDKIVIQLMKDRQSK